MINHYFALCKSLNLVVFAMTTIMVKMQRILKYLLLRNCKMDKAKAIRYIAHFGANSKLSFFYKWP